MDEDEFRKTYDNMRDYPCAYGKALLNRACVCHKSQKLNLGEREGITCTEWDAHRTCKSVLNAIRDNARFVVKATSVPGPLPHAKELRVQVGGLKGLHNIVGPFDSDTIDIHDVVSSALESYDAPDNLPFQKLVQSIASFEGRRRPREKR